jgi:multiple sugar transport system substrate-binding protein
MRRFLTTIILLGTLTALCPVIRPAHADGPTTIVFLTWKPNQPEGWNRLIKRFEREHPDIRIKRQVGPHSSTEYHAIVTQRLRNRDPSVDVFLMDVIWPPEFATAGWALDLSSRFPVREQQDFLTGPMEANTREGGIYGVPCYIGAGLFYYRKDLLEKYGFKPPQTWEEMIAQGETALKGEGDPGLVIYSGQFKQYEGLVCDMMEFIWSNGGAAIDNRTGRVLLDKPAAVQAVSFVRDRIIGKAAPRGVLNYEEPESLDLFIQGKAMFHRNWPYAWAVADDPETSRVAGRVGMGRLPHFPGHDSASALGGWQFGINRYSKHPEAAWQFIRFMTSAASQKILALESGLAPTRRSVYEDPLIQQKAPRLKAFLPAFEKARPRPLSPVYPMISQELQRFFSRAVAEDKSDIPAMARASSERIKRLVKLGATSLK